MPAAPLEAVGANMIIGSARSMIELCSYGVTSGALTCNLKATHTYEEWILN